MNRILLELRDLPNGTSTRSLSEDIGSLDLHRDEYVFFSPVQIDLEINKSERDIAITGGVTVPVQAECARCLQLFADEVKAGLEVRYFRTPGDPPTDRDSAGDALYHVRYDEPRLDLTGEIRQALLVSLPIRALCDSDCRGLCPTCGADLNEGDCSCSHKQGHPAWSALEKLKDGRESGEAAEE